VRTATQVTRMSSVAKHKVAGSTPVTRSEGNARVPRTGALPMGAGGDRSDLTGADVRRRDPRVGATRSRSRRWLPRPLLTPVRGCSGLSSRRGLATVSLLRLEPAAARTPGSFPCASSPRPRHAIVVENVAERGGRTEFQVGMVLAEMIAHRRGFDSANAIDDETQRAVPASDFVFHPTVEHASTLRASWPGR
jgi:hypothetical protein